MRLPPRRSSASKPVFWQTATLNDFLRGEVENLSIDGHGRLVLGPATELVAETTSPFLWAMAVAPDGSIYVGSGNEGKVFKIGAAGKAETFFDTTELEVHALALAPDGSLFAATSPEGRIYKIDRSGKGAPFFDPEDKYIWSLALDAQGNLYAGTGEKGLIYKITPDGKGTHVLRDEGDACHRADVRAQRAAAGRHRRTGTVVPRRRDRQGVSAARLDAPGNSRHPPRSAGQHLPRGAHRPHDVNEPAARVIHIRDAPSHVCARARSDRHDRSDRDCGCRYGRRIGRSAEAPAREDRRGGRGAIYRIRPDGLWDILWESAEDSPYDLTFDSSGALIVGTGRNGKLYSLSGEPTTATLLMQASAQQVTGFARDSKGNVIYATSNPGKVFRLSPQRAAEGTYTSLVRDAQTVADWGTLSWRASVPAGGRVDVFTRSGNTATPDDTWSAWSGPYAAANGEEIKSPNARYLQWKAVLAGKSSSPVLTSVSAAYVQRNLRPKVTSLTVHPVGHGVSEALPYGRSRTSPGSTIRRPIAAF